MYYSLSAIIVRIAALSLFFIVHPFPASIVNETVDGWDTGLSNIQKTQGNMKYQRPDKILDFLLYTGWLLLMPKKWFTKLLWFSIVFRAVGMAAFLKSNNEKWLTIFPNIFLYWFFILYGLDYFDIKLEGVGLFLILLLGILAKKVHENILRGKQNYIVKSRKYNKELRKSIAKLIAAFLKIKENTVELIFNILVSLSIMALFLTYWRTKKLFKPVI